MKPPNTPSPDAIRQGHYARKQLFSKSWLISWSHRSRFEMARRLVNEGAGQSQGRRILDYGCGDGTFLAMVAGDFAELVGADANPESTAEANGRLGGALKFISINDLRSISGGFDVVTCMETLEHVHADDMPGVLSDLARLTKPGGRVVISVPIEIGPTLLAKQAARRFAGWRNLGHYKYAERYRLAELARMCFAGQKTAISRQEHKLRFADGQELKGYGHHGFNWRHLREQIKRYLHIDRTLFTPLGWTRGLLSSQVWFVCSPGPALGSSPMAAGGLD